MKTIHEAKRLLRLGHLNDACTLLENAVAATPNCIELLRALGRVYLLCKRPIDAARTLEKALDLARPRLVSAATDRTPELSADDIRFVEEQHANACESTWADKAEDARFLDHTRASASDFLAMSMQGNVTRTNAKPSPFARGGDDAAASPTDQTVFAFVTECELAKSDKRNAIAVNAPADDSSCGTALQSPRADVCGEERLTNAQAVDDMHIGLTGISAGTDEGIQEDYPNRSHCASLETDRTIEIDATGALSGADDLVPLLNDDIPDVVNGITHQGLDDVADPEVRFHENRSPNRFEDPPRPGDDRESRFPPTAGNLLNVQRVGDDSMADTVDRIPLEELPKSRFGFVDGSIESEDFLLDADADQESIFEPVDDAIGDLELYASEPAQPDDERFESFLTDVDDVLVDEGRWHQPALPGGITREQKVRQVAARFIERWHWERSTFTLLTDFFELNGWSAALAALEREVEFGLSADELAVVMHLRQVWQDSDQYWTAFSPGGACQIQYRVLSWRLAVLICRNFSGTPAPEEAELLIESEFDRWYWDAALHSRFRSFAKYLFARVAGGYQMLSPESPEDFSDFRATDFDDASDLGLVDINGACQRTLLDQWGFRIFEGPREHLRGLSDHSQAKPTNA